MKNQYHIDVTEEEDALFRDKQPAEQTKSLKMLYSLSFLKALGVVVAVHCVGVGLLFGLQNQTKQTSASSNRTEDKQQPEPVANAYAEPISKNSSVPLTEDEQIKIEDKQYLQQSQLNQGPVEVGEPIPTQETAAVQQPSQPSVPEASPQSPPPSTTQYKKEYVVKKGDCITAIAKKYKLSVPRLLKLNNLQDPNKIQVGQTLKFM